MCVELMFTQQSENFAKEKKKKKCSCKPLMIDKKVDEMGSINEESN
jgi:hypothetical protein